MARKAYSPKCAIDADNLETVQQLAQLLAGSNNINGYLTTATNLIIRLYGKKALQRMGLAAEGETLAPLPPEPCCEAASPSSGSASANGAVRSAKPKSSKLDNFRRLP